MSIIDRSRWSRQEIILLGGIFVLSIVMMAARWNEAPIGANTDDAYYIEMARSIADGQGPVVNTGPDTKVANPDIFPVGFPIFLSLPAKLFPNSWAALKTIPLLFTLLLIPLCLVLPGHQAENKTRLLMVTLVILNPWVIAWSGRVLSDTVFTVVSLSALLVFSSLEREVGFRKKLLGVALLCALAISVRTVGWSLVFVVAITFLAQRRFLLAAGFPFVVAIILTPGWMYEGGEASPITGAYWAQMFARNADGVWPLVSYNFLHYLAELPVILVPVFGGALDGIMVRLGLGWLYFPAAVAVGFTFLVLMGIALVKFRTHKIIGPKARLFGLYLIIYGAVLLNFDGYPSGVQTRLLIPVLPVFCWLVWLGLNSITKTNRKILPWAVIGMMVLASLVHNGWRIAHPLRSSVDASGQGYVDPEVGARWIHDHSALSAVVMVQEPLVRHIHFGRDVVGFPTKLSKEELFLKLDEHSVEFVFVGPSVHHIPRQLDEKGKAMLTLLKSMPDIFEAVEINSTEKIYFFRRI